MMIDYQLQFFHSRIVDIKFTNHIRDNENPVLLKFYENDDTEGWKERDELALSNGDGVILTYKQGVLNALMKKNPFTGNKYILQISGIEVI